MKLISLLFVLAAVFVAGCGKGNFSETANQGKENIFRYAIRQNPTTLDPGAVEDGDTIDLLQQVFEGLVAYDETNAIKGVLAQDWTVSEDGTVYTFNIKQGVKFHSGRELTAEDFKKTIERNATPEYQSPTILSYLSDIVGLKERVNKKPTDAGPAEITGIQVKDKYVLEITIDKPRPYFLGKLCYPVSWVVDTEKVAATEKIKNVAEMVGTGPFMADRYEEGTITVLKANPDYHLGAPKLAGIERPVIRDSQARLNKYLGGQSDLIQLERQDVPAIQADDKVSSQLQFFPRPSIFYVGMNSRVYPVLKNRLVRRAIAMAINKERIVKDVLQGHVQIANGIIPPGVPGHRQNANTIKFDPAEAKRVLAQAGYPGGKGMPEMQVDVRMGAKDYQDVAEAVASDLQNNLGLKVSVNPIEWGTYLDMRLKWKIGLFHMRWAADYLDPQNFLSMMLGTYSEDPPFGPENRMDYSNKQFDALCQEADSIMDQPKRLQLYAQAEDLVLQDAPWVPIYFQRDAELISPRVKGIRSNLFGHLPHYTVELN